VRFALSIAWSDGYGNPPTRYEEIKKGKVEIPLLIWGMISKVKLLVNIPCSSSPNLNPTPTYKVRY
jgi:hypothetical protein